MALALIVSHVVNFSFYIMERQLVNVIEYVVQNIQTKVVLSQIQSIITFLKISVLYRAASVPKNNEFIKF